MAMLPRVRAIAATFTTRRIVLATAGALVTLGVVTVVRPDPMQVETAAVRRAPLRVTVDADGRTRVRERYVVASPVPGRLERIPLVEGDDVRPGDVIARVAPAPLDAPSARQAQARLDAARALAREADARVRGAAAGAEQARRDAARTRRLLEVGAVAPRALEEADLAARTRADDLAAARAHAAAARAEIDGATAALLHAGGATGPATGDGRGIVVVRAPAGGRVLRLAEQSERVIAPGAMLAEIGDVRRLEVVVDVLSSDAARVRPGMPVLLDGWGAAGQPVVRGRVRRVEAAASTRVSALGVEEQRVDVLVDVVDPPPSLGDGYRMDAHIVVWEGEAVLSVPASALVRVGSGWGVYAVESGRIQLRAVRIGQMGGASVEVAGGLREGARVVVLPSDQVRAGARVASR
jgi:HlyD family secretion protein